MEKNYRISIQQEFFFTEFLCKILMHLILFFPNFFDTLFHHSKVVLTTCDFSAYSPK